MSDDALGRRYSRASGGTTTVYYYAGNAVVLEKQGGTFTAAYTYGNALLRRNSEYPLYDGHGSERTVTNGSQTVTGTINFEAFGQTVGTSGSSSSPYMYAGAWGYRTDGDVGLMHVGARYYDAQVGRFITRDTVLSEHPYLYCEHDPVNAVDPSGHIVPLIVFGVAVGLGAYAGIHLWFGAQEVASVVSAGDSMHQMIDDWRPATDSGIEFQMTLHPNITGWVIDTGKGPASDVIGGLATGLLGLGTPSISKAIHRVVQVIH